MSRPLLTALLAMAMATPLSAQEATDDWDAVVDPARGLTLAQTDFSNGLSLAVRCVNGGFDAVVAGLPPPPAGAQTRVLSVQFGEDEQQVMRWNVAVSPSIAVSEMPAPFARNLRRGGQLQIVARGAGAGGGNIRYVLDLPTSSASIDRVLEACDRPLVDQRDAELAAVGEGGLPEGAEWARPPEPRMPDPLKYERGFAVITCLTQADGAMRDCVVEAENPIDGGFGEAALRATRRARIRNVADPEGPVPLARIVYRTNFGLESVMESELRDRASRLPPRSPPTE